MPNMSPSRAKAILDNILTGRRSGTEIYGVMLKAIQTSSCDQGDLIEEVSSEDGNQGDAIQAGLNEIARLMGDPYATPNDYIDYDYAALIQTVENSQTVYGIVALHSNTRDDYYMDAIMLEFFEPHETFFSDAEFMRASESSCE